MNNRADHHSQKLSYKKITPYLRKQLYPLSLTVFIVVGGLTPWLYQKGRQRDAQREASYMVQSISQGLKQLAAQDPFLWPYRPQAIHQLIRPFEKLGSYVVCDINNGRTIYKSKIPEQTLVSYQTKIERSVYNSNDERIANISFYLTFEEDQWNSLPWIFALIMALLLSWLLLSVPLQSAKKADTINHRLLKEILELNEDLEQRVIERTSELEEVNQRLYSVQDEERSRISRDLHDELGQTLTGLRLQLTALEYSLQNQNYDGLNQVKYLSNIVDLGIDQVRSIAYAQKPPELDMLSLFDAINSMITRLNRGTKLSITFQSQLNSKEYNSLSDETNTTIFRVIQEALTNILRHSSATTAQVILIYKPNNLQLSVIDNGSLKETHFEWGLGLNGIQARVKRLNGSIKLNTAQTGGLHLSVDIPRKR